MSKITLILEALFTGADEEECKRRDAEAPKIMLHEWIEEFLKRKDIKKLSDGSYDVRGDVALRDSQLEAIPVKFNKVTGFFDVSNNDLTSLAGCPKEVGAWFSCSHNQLLTSLVGAPTIVRNGSFEAMDCNLTSLKGCPKIVGESFYIKDQWSDCRFTEHEIRKHCKVGGLIES